MRVFVTGATGFIGSAVVADLLRAGHQVLGLARSDEGARGLIAAGAEVQRGDLSDLEGLRAGAAQSDGVIHTAFIHDFSKFQENCAIDKRAIETLGDALAGSNRPLIVSAGLGLLAPGRVATEDDAVPPNPHMPRVSEQTAESFVERGVRVATIRLPQVHNTFKQGLITYALAIARQKGVSAYVADGLNRWPAVHLLDAAPLYRIALEKAPAGARYHAVAEEGVRVKEIAEAIGKGLGIPVVSKSPEQAAEHFGWLALFAGLDMSASSALTKQRLSWQPTHSDLLTDLGNMDYSAA
ncbi:MAG TPA: SDR family oxidoreductase [Terracidiphilus sp.]|jgi:nucleoside-diphosphate-sugar epimerase|nr:SDR family oxidoreductase [Terracidiphilus sp.]